MGITINASQPVAKVLETLYRGGGGGDRGVTISRLPYLFVPLSPDSRPLLCFSRYRVNDAV